MFNSIYYLMMVISGLEISAYSPFNFKTTKTGLLKNLENLNAELENDN